MLIKMFFFSEINLREKILSSIGGDSEEIKEK